MNIPPRLDAKNQLLLLAIPHPFSQSLIDITAFLLFYPNYPFHILYPPCNLTNNWLFHSKQRGKTFFLSRKDSPFLNSALLYRQYHLFNTALHFVNIALVDFSGPFPLLFLHLHHKRRYLRQEAALRVGRIPVGRCDQHLLASISK